MSPRAPHPPPRSVEDGDSDRDAVQAGLVWICDTEPGIRRQRAGKGFCYRLPGTGSARGGVVRDAATLQRIRALAIPPAWTDVWICTRANGHVQATGRDARGRKQYRYHADWQQVRDAGKFDRIVAFGRTLPKLRRRLRADLKPRGFPRNKVLAIVVSIMAETLVRIGNDAYARDNHSYGLTTLRNRHIAFVRGGRARLSFRGKAGLVHDIAIGDARLVKLVRGCQELPGQALFQYRDDDGAVQPVDSGAVNAYLHDVIGDGFNAKDFRTWGGTFHAFRLFAQTPLPEGTQDRPPSERSLAEVEKQVIAQVAKILGNTPAVCRKAYVDPAVPAGWRDGSLARMAGGARGARQWEQATLRFLQRARRGRKR